MPSTRRSLLSAVLLGAALGAALMAIVNALGANPHTLSGRACRLPARTPYSKLTLEQKAKLARCNIAHSSGALAWIRQHHAGRELASVRRDHARTLRRARANLRAIEAALHPHPASIRGIICYVWGDQCSNALAVVQCESNFDIYNQTGQYWGLFQMGEWARANYGFAWDAWQQTRGAYALYQDMGWSPWECAYIVGII